MIILGIETSGKTASVAVSDGERILGETGYAAKLTHSQVILPLAEELLSKLELTVGDVDCVAVSNGPGSYTGLRIGVAAAKGLSFGSGMKCCGVSSMKALAYNLAAFEGVVAAAVYARPETAYFGAYLFKNGKAETVLKDRVCGYGQLGELIGGIGGRVMLTGDLSEKVKSDFFASRGDILLSPPSLRFQRASSLCAIAAGAPGDWVSGERLNACYLQDTKAEKQRQQV